MRSCLLSIISVAALAFLRETAGDRGVDTVCYNVKPLMTTSNGAPVDDKTASMSAGPEGPVVLQDFVLLDELSKFNRERVPERVAHARGAGAFGTFTVTDTSFTEYCRASLFQEVGKKTELVVRFSTNSMETGSCETIRDMRGVAVKFYTDDGNFDLVGSNFDVFWVRDPSLFVSLAHTQKRHPSSHLSNAFNLWDFITLNPQTTHNLMYIFSDLGTPDGYRHMDFHGTHAFKVVNKDKIPFYCKFHFKTNQGVRNLTGNEFNKLCGTDPDYATRDLYENIAKGNYPSWTMYYQVMTVEEANNYRWNPFDLTKVWLEADHPWHEIGTLELNRNPSNYFDDVEQTAFTPSRLVLGIEPSPDKMFQARLFAYTDTQRYRLGVNYQQLPVNAPRVPVINAKGDGRMDYHNLGSAPNYFPNSFSDSAQPCPEAAQATYPVTGDVARYKTDDEDNFSQPAIFWKETLNEVDRQRLIVNMGTFIKPAPKELQQKLISNLKNVAEDLADRLVTFLDSTEE